MTVKTEDKKSLKKWLTRKRNLRDLLMLQHLLQVREEEKRRSDETEAFQRHAEGDQKSDNEVWSAKTQEIRNRLTNKKRSASERWNRFAGTDSSGSRGL